ncbi:MAG: GatB/YqeY domain-containing protein [Gaiellales bacterium]
MPLIDDIETSLKSAMRARDELRTSTLRLVLSSLRAAEKEKRAALSEAEEIRVLQRERKRRVEAEDAYGEAGRLEQADREHAELAVIDEFMPSQLSDDELAGLVDDAIESTGATSAAEVGRVMGAVMPRVAGQAEGNRVREVVTARLGSSAGSG